jgi:hypothetical protein
VQDVADDHDALALEPAEPLPDGQRVQQRLGGVLVRAVAGVDDRWSPAARFGRPLRQLVGRPGGRVPDDQRVGAGGAQGQRGVAQRLPLATEEPDALTLMVSALIHLAATSKDTRVRVEFS